MIQQRIHRYPRSYGELNVCAVQLSRSSSRVVRCTAQAHCAVIDQAPVSTSQEGGLTLRQDAPVQITKPQVEEWRAETFDQAMETAGDSLVLVDFYTDWCGPCKLMHKEMEKLTKAFPKGVRFAKFNCGRDEAAEQFSTQHRIRSLPTFRLYKQRRLLDQVTGAKPVQLRQLLVHYYRPM